MPAFQDPEIYRDILDALQIGVSVLDVQKQIIFWSDGAEHITGYSRIDVLGHSCTSSILQHCDQASCEMCGEKCPLAAVLHDAKPVEATTFIHHKEGHRIPVYAWAIPLRDKHGSIIGIIQTFEEESAANSPHLNDRSMRERGSLDETTGLPNQAMMQSHLRETVGRFVELQVPFSVICVEPREIGQFRARCGQEAGNCILQVLARTLRNTVWSTDYVGCWTEGRFLVILSGCGEVALRAVAGRIMRMMASATIKWWGEELSVKVALGRTCAVEGDTIKSVLERAQRVQHDEEIAGTLHAAAAPGVRLSRS
jgi:diguanylate cyclase (GGDEF)-like protein/PAS domain S-box-containing protein